MPTPAAIRATVDSYITAFTDSDRTGWLGCFAPDATLEDPVGTEVRVGRQAIGEFFDSAQGMVESIRMEGTGPVRVAGDEAAFPFQIHTVVGGDRFVLDVIDVMSFDDDARITSMRAFWSFDDMRPE